MISTSPPATGTGTWPVPIHRQMLPSPHKRRSPIPATAISPPWPIACPPRRPRRSSNITACRSHASANQGAKRAAGIGCSRHRTSPQRKSQPPIASWPLNSTTPSPRTLDAVRDGLRDSVRYGMAHNAAVPGMEIAGKTGTASDTAGFEPRLVCRHRLPRPPRSRDRDLSAAGQWSRCRPPGPALLSCRKTIRSASAGQRPRAHHRALGFPIGDPPHRNPLGSTSKPLERRLAARRTSNLSRKDPKHLELSGNFRLQAPDAPEVVAAGSWTFRWQRDGLRVLLTLPSESYVMAALSGEAAPDEPMASLKAMAISMRTFALENANRHQRRRFWSLRQHPLPGASPGQSPARGGAGGAGNSRRNAMVRRPAGAHLLHPALWRHERTGQCRLARRACQLPGWASCRSLLPAPLPCPVARANRIDPAQRNFSRPGLADPSPIESIRVIQQSATGRAELLEVTGRGAPARLSASSFRFAVDRALGWNQMRSDWYTATYRALPSRSKAEATGTAWACARRALLKWPRKATATPRFSVSTSPAPSPASPRQDHGWQKVTAAGWTLLTTDPAGGLLAEGNAAWAKAQSLLGEPAPSQGPTVQESAHHRAIPADDGRAGLDARLDSWQQRIPAASFGAAKQRRRPSAAFARVSPCAGRAASRRKRSIVVT